MQTKEARGGVGGEVLTDLGEGREENCGEPLEKSWGLELEKTEGTLVYLVLFFFFLINLLRQKFEWGLRDWPIFKSPQPRWCRPPGSRPLVCGSIPCVPGKLLPAASDRGTPRPSSPGPMRTGSPSARRQFGGGPAGGGPGPWGCVSLVTWGLSRLSPVPLGSFVLRAVRGDRPGRSRGWGWGCWSTTEVWEAPGREKLAPHQQGCARIFISTKSEGEAIAPVSVSKPALGALHRQRWRRDSNLEPPGPALSLRQGQLSFSSHHPTPSQHSALVEQLYWRVPESECREPGGTPSAERPTALRRRGRCRAAARVLAD